MSEPSHQPQDWPRNPRAEVERLLDQLSRAIDEEAWHGPSLLPLLAPISAEHATRRPLPNRHTIWELTTHLTAWTTIARRVIQGEQFEITPEMDWPEIPDTSESGWRATVDAFRTAWHGLQDVVKGLDDQALRKRPPGGPRFTVYAIVIGVVQHVAYHAGQIAILS